jgi:invasion protein IalB
VARKKPRDRIFAAFSGELTIPSPLAPGCSGRYERQIIVQERIIVRISRHSFVVAFAGLLALSCPAMSQDNSQTGKSDTEAPADATQQFGPRAQAAQGEQQQGPQAEVVSKHGDWEVQCTAIPEAQGQPASKACGMVQSGFSEKNKDIGVQVIVSRIKQGDKSATVMRVLAPIGVYLPTGIPMEIDGEALPGRMQFTRCLPRICESYGEASDKSLAKLKKGKAITFFLYDRPGNSYPVQMKLAGFGDALAALSKL